MQPVQLDQYNSIVRWVARKDRAGHLSGLSKVMLVTDSNWSSREAYFACRHVKPKVITLIYSHWPLTCVQLQGRLNFNNAVSALPSSIQQLTLIATAFDRLTDEEGIDLDQMKKFHDLSRLKLDMFTNNVLLSGPRSSNLTHLHIGPRTIHWSPLCNQDFWCSTDPLNDDQNECLLMCLPRLKHMTAGVTATCVQTMLDILTLKSADLVLQFGYDSYLDLCLEPVHLVVQESSGLAHLKIDASGSRSVVLKACISELKKNCILKG